ncbi:hypothetical protein TIFTF001_019675 [Ficus carica]|uniref:Uncharacterized protein n=1 Tax=Ficus carica TaxID=3494 RepID=A0AA88AGU1_FICCA|nr:hypothetical protein TIFTF001_019675 [Ficus carica]
MYGLVDSMALRCVLELRIPDIINSHGGPMTLAQIGSAISEASAAAEEASTPDIFCLARIMRFLVRRNIFTVHHPSNGSGSTDDNHDQALYGLSHLSRWLIFSDGDDDERNLGPMFLSQTHPRLMKPWHFLSRCIKEGGGGVAFDKAHGRDAFSLMSEDSEFAKVFNYGMECTSRIVVKAVLEEYRDGFSCLGSLVDVGGGTGAAMSEIVKSHPHIKGINFDLPHVVSTAPAYPGVSHVGGNMFDSIPNADAVFMKLRIPDIINSHGGPISLSQIASTIPEASAAAEAEASSPNISCLAVIMRFLVRRNIFTVRHPSNGSGDDSTDDDHDQALYGLTHLSRWLIFSDGDDEERNLGPMFLLQTHPRLMKPWHFLSRCIKEGGGGIAFDKAHGRDVFSLMSEDSGFAKVFDYGMECTSRIVVKAVLEEYRDGFSCLGSLVDVGGGTGAIVSEIVKSHPHIKGINFDLPHVVSTAPAYPGVSHVGGNMFDAIPNADAVFMKVNLSLLLFFITVIG